MSRLLRGAFGILAAFAIMALCGIGASTASAVEFKLLTALTCEGGTQIVFCWENNANPNTLLELEGEEEVTILSPVAVTLLSTLGGESIEINCSLIDATPGLILQTEPLVKSYTINATLLFLECLLVGTVGAKCKIPTEKATSALIATPTSAQDLVFKPETGTTFIEIPISQRSGCPSTLIKTAKVTGTQLCEFESTISTVDVTEHLLECGQSSLQFAENEASFYANTLVEPVHGNERSDIVEVG
jgi:hypothetical protein